MSRQYTLYSAEIATAGQPLAYRHSFADGGELKIETQVEFGPHLTIRRDPGNSFYVELHNRMLQPVSEASKWRLNTLGASIQPGGDVGGLLLAPSLIGNSLYGSKGSPGKAAEQEFGYIATMQDTRTKKWELLIQMPEFTFRGLGALTITAP